MKTPSPRFSALLVLILLGLILSACIPNELTTPPLDEPQSPSPEPSQTITEPQFETYSNSALFSYMPFEILYDTELWFKGDPSSGLISTTIPNCNLRALLGRGTSGREGPFQLNAGENNFEYYTELPADSISQTKTYFFYLKPDDPALQREDVMWAFEMLTKAENEETCLQAVQPLLASLTVSLPEAKESNFVLGWDESLAQDHCPISTKGRLFTIAERNGQLILSSGQDLNQLYLLDQATSQVSPLLSSAFDGGVIQPPLQIDGDHLVYLDSENYMLTQGWNISSYNFTTQENQILLSSADYPTASALFTYFDVENGPVYVSIVESPADVGIDKSSILKIDLASGVVEEIYALESDQFRLGRLSVNPSYLLVEQVPLTKPTEPYQGLIMLKFDPSNAQQDFPLNGWNPMLSKDRAVFASGSSNQFPTSVTVSDLWGQQPYYMDLPGVNAMLQFLTGDYLTWQGSGGPEAPTIGIYLANLATKKTFNLVSPDSTTSLIMPIIIDESLYFGMVTGYSTPEETTHICSLPLNELIDLTSKEASSNTLLPYQSTDLSGLTLESIPLLHSGLLDPDQPGYTVTLDEAHEERLKTYLREFGGYYNQQFALEGASRGTDSFYAIEEALSEPGEAIPSAIVRVIKDDEELFSVDTGVFGSNSSLRNFLILENGKWVLEVTENRPAGGDQQEVERITSVFYDGDSLNEILNADEVFNYRYLGGKEFFFLRRGSQYAYVLDGEEYALPFDLIRHNLCCGYALYDPTNYQNVVTFYAMRGEQEYYAILGMPID